MSLPADIHKLVVAALNVPTPVFLPTYDVKEETGPYGNLAKKHEEYYGNRSDEETAASLASVNWSSTCHFYRDLLAPSLFSALILRPRPKSMETMQLLATTPHWRHIASLAFVGTYAHPDRTRQRGSQHIDPLEDFDFDALSVLLSHLPPNLKSLSLDFPTDWDLECDDDYLSVFDVDEAPEETLEQESSNAWRKLVFTVLDAVTKTDFSSRESFELKLLNIPPLPCSVYWSDEFHQLLKCTTDFTLAFDHFDNGAGWNMNTMEMPVHFASKLDQWFWDHLTNVKSLSIHADDSWPIGLAPGRCHIPLAVPSDDFRFDLTHLSLKWWFIDSELIIFITKHMPSLTHITITNYYANCQEYSTSNADSTPKWSSFFEALRQHPSLAYITLYPHLSGLRLLDPFNRDKGQLPQTAEASFRAAWEEISLLLASKQSLREAGTWTEKEDVRMKRLWPHVGLDDKYGMIFDNEEYNADRFVEGSDHTAWLKLCDELEKRGGGCRIVDVGEKGNKRWANRE